MLVFSNNLQNTQQEHSGWTRPLSLLTGIVGLGLLLGTVGSVYAAEPPEMVTDRPDQTESSLVVPPGLVQLEIGYLFTNDDSGGVETSTYEFPFTLARIGLIDRVELRIGFAGVTSQQTSPGGAGVDGFGDGELGTKIVLWEEEGFIPQTALLAGTSVPFGGASFSSERFDPFLIGLFSHSLTEWLELGYNLGVVWSSEAVAGSKSRDTFPAFKYTVSTGWGLTDNLGMFTEFFGEIPEERFAAHSFDAGFTYSVAPNVQLDIEAGIGLNRAAPDYFFGTGIVVRFPQ